MKKASKWLTIFLAIMMVVSVGLVGCGKKDTGQPAGNNDQVAAPSEPQELHMMLTSEPPTLDAQLTTDQVSMHTLNAVQEGLVRMNPDGEITPGMAESWEISEDGLTYTFKLRKDAKWSNGDPITAQSFIDGWERAVNAENASQYANMIYDYVKGAKEYYDYTNYLVLKDLYENNKAKYDEAHKGEDGTVPTPDVVAFGEEKVDVTPVTWDTVGVKATDEYTLEVELAQPTAWFLETTQFATYMPFNKAFYEANKDNYATEVDKLLYNGPFIIDQWLHEQKIVLKKNENYWDKDAVKLETITFDIVNDNTTALSLYEAGDVDRTSLSRETVSLYEDDPNFVTFGEMVLAYFQFNNTQKPFDNVKVRKAISLAVDRQAYVDTVLNNGSVPGFGLVPNDFAAYSGSTTTFREASAAKYNGELFSDNNPEEAKKLLAEGLQESGINPDGFTFRFLTDDSETARKSAEFLKSQWKQNLGVDIKIEQVPFAERLNRSKTQNFDVVMSLWGPDYNDPLTWLFLFEGDSPYNDGKWNNEEYNDLVNKAREEQDPEKRLNYFLEAEKVLIQDEIGIAPVYYRNLASLQRPYVKDLFQKVFGSDFEYKWAYIEGKEGK